MDWVTLTSAKSVAGSLANWVNNSTITTGAGGVADVIQGEALLMISSRLRHWRMLTPPVAGIMTPVTVPTPTGQDTIPVPTDLAELDIFRLIGNYQFFLRRKDRQEVIANWAWDGDGNRVPQMPVMYYVDQSNIAFDSPPDQAYQYVYTYFQQIPQLSATNTTNFITTYYPRLMRAACMINVAEWTKESGQGTFDRTYWDQIFDEAVDSAQRDSDQSHRAVEAGAVFIGGGAGNYPTHGW